ncbi:MAG: helix-turn-helix domain-containing protein, partial [Halalkalicoccus sp.]|nr:helix-turn-helix domain-containing protein [Halalkalicoccus sp.]
ARVTYANERAEELLERSAGELVGSVIWDTFPESTGTTFEDQYRRAVRTQEPVSYESYSPDLDRWFAVRAYPTETGVTAYLRDVTGRKRREQRLGSQRAELAAINHLNRVIREATHAAIETPSRERIEQRVCDRLVDSELYAFAWTGSIEKGTRDVTWDCMTGGDRSYLEACRSSIERTDPSGRGPTGTAIRTHEPQFVQDMRTDPDYGPWRAEALERGFRASAAIPLLYDGVLYSVLNLYSTHVNAFTTAVREALDHLGTVVGHAIHAAEQRTALLSESVREIELRNEDFAQRLVGSDSEVHLSVDRTVPTGEGRILHFMEVSEMSAEEFVDSITRVSTVEEVTLLEEDERDGSLVFEVTIAEPSLTGTLVSYGGRVRSVRTTADGTRIVAQLPPSAPIREVVEAVNEVHPGTELIAQRAVEHEPRTTREIYSVIMDRLTEKQRAALETAYFAGYFEWPRSVTGEDVAAMLGITAPTFTNHMRIAERKLLAVLFSDDTDPVSRE